MAEDARRRGGGLGFIPWLLGFAISTGSIATLVHYGIVTEDLSAPIQALIDAYHEGIGIVFDPIEPYVRDVAHWLGGLVGWDIHLYPHWRHVFLLSMVLFLAAARVSGGAGDLRTAALFGGFGALCSLAGALIAGALPLGGDARSEAVIFAAPLGAILAALMLATAVDALLAGRRGYAVLVFAVALGFAAFFAFLAAFGAPPYYKSLRAMGAASPGLLALGLFEILLALGYLVGGALLARVLLNDSVQVGLVMLSGFLGTALLFAADAALKLAAP
ncbi:MAG: hypothetical protein H6923_05750 [Alphaproteobacteria bacterium]|nr:hypothetical protein [Alphaproteobacteria bacterium]